MEDEIINNEENLVREVSLPLYGSKGWIKFLGILMIIYGALVALSIVGIIIAWLPIWLGILLVKTADSVQQAHLAGDKTAMLKAQNSLSTYFTIYGVLALIGIALTVLIVIVFMSTGMMYHFQDMIQEGYYQ
jgi:hypothetical protein